MSFTALLRALTVVVCSTLLLPVEVVHAQMQSGDVSSDGMLEQIDTDGDGVNTFGDREVVLWWVFNGGDLSELWAALAEAKPGAGGLYDISSWIQSPGAQLPNGPAAAAASGGGGVCPCPPESPACGSDPMILVCEFLRGDANRDGSVNITDATAILNFVFLGVPICDEDAADANDDGSINISDPVRLLDFLFGMGPLLAEPTGVAGLDPTVDSLNIGCSDFLLGSVEQAICENSSHAGHGLCYLEEPPEPMGEPPKVGSGFAFGGPHVGMPPEYFCYSKPTPSRPGGGGSTPPTPPPFPGAGGECINYTCPEAAAGSSLTLDGMFSIGPGEGNSAGLSSVEVTSSVSDGWQDLCNVTGFSRFGILDENGVEWAWVVTTTTAHTSSFRGAESTTRSP